MCDAIVRTPTTQVFYAFGGACSSQTYAVSTGADFTMQHKIEVADGSSSFWYSDALVRPSGTARWTVNMRRDSADVFQWAAISEGQFPVNAFQAYQNTLLASVTNTAATGAWYSTSLSWQNPNNYAAQVRLYIMSTGLLNSLSYSAAIKGQDNVLKMVP